MSGAGSTNWLSSRQWGEGKHALCAPGREGEGQCKVITFTFQEGVVQGQQQRLVWTCAMRRGEVQSNGRQVPGAMAQTSGLVRNTSCSGGRGRRTSGTCVRRRGAVQCDRFHVTGTMRDIASGWRGTGTVQRLVRTRVRRREAAQSDRLQVTGAMAQASLLIPLKPPLTREAHCRFSTCAWRLLPADPPLRTCTTHRSGASP